MSQFLIRLVQAEKETSLILTMGTGKRVRESAVSSCTNRLPTDSDTRPARFSAEFWAVGADRTATERSLHAGRIANLRIGAHRVCAGRAQQRYARPQAARR